MIKYYRLLDILNRRSMTKEELRQQIGISSATMCKICEALGCQPGDLMEYLPGNEVRDLYQHTEHRGEL